MTAFVSTIVAGVLAGAVYGLIASGLALEFGVMRVINFAHGFLVSASMYACLYLFNAFSLSPFTALLILIPGGFLVGMAVYRFVIRPFLKAGAQPIVIALVTLALGLVIQQLIITIAGAQARSITTGLSSLGWHPSDIYIGGAQLVAAGMAVVAILGVILLLRYTRWGRTARAVAQDPEAARTLGIDPDSVSTVAFGIGTALAAVAGVALISYLPTTPEDGLNYSLVSFVVVVLGGLSSLRGALVAAIVIGVVTNLVGFYWTSSMQTAAYLVVFLIVLLVRPQGLFGRKGDLGEIRV